MMAASSPRPSSAPVQQQQQHRRPAPAAVTPASPPRDHLLYDLAKFGELLEAAAHGDLDKLQPGTDGDQWRKEKKQKAEERRKKASITPTKPKESFVVSLFGTSPRKSSGNADSQASAVLGAGSYALPPPPIGVAPSFPTAPRWEGGNSATPTTTRAAATPSPATYDARPVRPHSASAVIGTSPRGPTVLIKGIVVPVAETPTPPPQKKKAGTDDATAEVGAPSPSPSRTPGVSFTRARRFDPEGPSTPRGGGVGEAATAANSAGPQSYSPRVVDRHAPSAVIPASPRSQNFIVHGNHLIHRSSSKDGGRAAALGPGSYDSADSGGLRGRQSHGVTIPKAPRQSSTGAAKHQPPDVDAAGSSLSSPAYPESIAARLARGRAHPTFTAAPRNLDFALHGGCVVYQVRSRSAVDTPGVGAHDVKDGRTLAETVANAVAHSGRRSAAAIAAGAAATNSPTRTAATVAVTPGPADYDTSVRKSMTFNRYLRSAQEHWAKTRHV